MEGSRCDGDCQDGGRSLMRKQRTRLVVRMETWLVFRIVKCSFGSLISCKSRLVQAIISLRHFPIPTKQEQICHVCDSIGEK